MQDSLDLEALVQQGTAYRQKTRRVWRRTALIFVIGAALLLGLQLVFLRSAGSLYLYENGQWQTISLPDSDGPHEIQVAEDGTVWLHSFVYARLYRYQNGAWTEFDCNDFHTSCSEVRYFAVFGQDLWAVVEDALVHFDGQQWTAYANTLGNDVAGLVANSDGVLIVTHYGGFVRFNGQNWDYQPPLAQVSAPADPDKPTRIMLRQSPNGTIWLLNEALWRFDGQEWQLVQPISPESAPYYWLAGVDNETAWVYDGRGLIAFDAQTGDELQYFPLDEIDADHQTGIYQVKTIDGLIWAATTTGIFTFDGADWQRQPLATRDVFRSLGADAQGRVWVSSLNPQLYEEPGFVRQQTILSTLLRSLGAPVVLLIGVVYYLAATQRPALERAKLARQRLAEVLPHLKPYAPLYHNPARSARINVLTYILILAIAIALPFLRVSPTISILIFAVLLVSWGVRPLLLRWFNPKTDAPTRAYLRRNIVVGAFVVLLMIGSMLALLAIGNAVFGNLYEQPPLVVLGFFALILAIAVVFIYDLLLQPNIRIYQTGLARGDYETALNQVRALRRRMSHYVNFISLEGSVLLLAGRPMEAEPVWRDLLTEVQNHNAFTIALGLVNLGYALTAQKRYDEALPLLSAALQIAPEQGSMYHVLADWYHEQKIEPDRALLLTDCALRFTQKPRFNWLLQKHSWAMLLNSRALALANVGRFDEAQAILERAFKEGDPQFRPGVAALHETAGQMQQRQGQLDAARAAFTRAFELDPHGAAGKSALENLEKLDKA